MLEQSKSASGERFQRDLFNFTIHVDNSAIPDSTSPADAQLIRLRRTVQERMRLGEYEFKQSARFSPADLGGMDYVLFSRALNRMYFLDVTTDFVVKWSLPRLRRDNLFLIEVDPSGAVTKECKRAFLEKLLDIMSEPSLLTMQECHHPSIDNLAPRQVAAELESFRARLQGRVEFFRMMANSRKENAQDFNLKADLIREYRADLERVRSFASCEDLRQTDPVNLVQQAVFEAWASTAALSAVRETISPGTQPLRSRLDTHTAEYEEHRDQVVLFVQGRRYRLMNITAFIAKATEKVWTVKKMRPDLYSRKTLTASGTGQKLSIENLTRIIETTPVLVLLGDTFPRPTPPAFKPGSKRFGSAARRPGG